MRNRSLVFVMTAFFAVLMTAFSAVLLSGCSDPPSGFVEGEIVRISSNLSNLESNAEWNGLVSYSNETVKFGNGLVLEVRTSDGTYFIQVDPTDRGGSSGPQTLIGLAGALKVGSRVRFPTELDGQQNPDRQPMGFSASKIGMLDPDDIQLLAQTEQ